jgi:alkylation response protein AidB-like acyl-CoA dehydrogenase
VQAQYIQRVRALAPVFVDAQVHQEAAGELDPRLVAEMHTAGLFRMLLPARLNGAALDPLTYTGVVEEIARQDPSAAWCVNQGSGCSMVAGYLDPAIARRVFGNPTDVLALGAVAGRQGGRRRGRLSPELQRLFRQRQPACHLARRPLPGL